MRSFFRVSDIFFLSSSLRLLISFRRLSGVLSSPFRAELLAVRFASVRFALKWFVRALASACVLVQIARTLDRMASNRFLVRLNKQLSLESKAEPGQFITLQPSSMRENYLENEGWYELRLR